jgi:hypothetical protein
MCSDEFSVIQCRTLSQHPQYRCTHYTLLSTAICFQSVCNSVTPWCVILLSTNSSPLVHPPVHIPPAPHQSRHPPQGLSRKMRTVLTLRSFHTMQRMDRILRSPSVYLCVCMLRKPFDESLKINGILVHTENWLLK